MGIVFPFPRASNFVVGCISLFWFWSNFSRYIIGMDRWMGGWMDGWMTVGWSKDVDWFGCCFSCCIFLWLLLLASLLLEATGS